MKGGKDMAIAKAEPTIEPVKEFTLDDIRAEIKKIEEYYKVSSEEFIKLWREGKFEDTYWTNRWAIHLNFLEEAEKPGVIVGSDFDKEELDNG